MKTTPKQAETTIVADPRTMVGEPRRDRWLTLVLLAIGASQWSACSSDSSHSGGEQSPLVDGGGSGGGASDSGGGTGGTLGDSGARPAIGTCTSPTPLRGGWVRCAEGFDHRTASERCEPQLADGGPTWVSCDSCMISTHANCVDFSTQIYSDCRLGCEVDSDCPSGMGCYCDGPLGYCISTDCSTDADCGSGSLCATYQLLGSCIQGVIGAQCQQEGDECVGSADCIAQSKGTLTLCGVGTDYRVCGNGLGGCGRPFLVGGGARVATTAPRCDWFANGIAPSTLTTLSAEQRATCADHWSHMALMEHASVAAFARFMLELLALGAPSNLVQDCGEALNDERRHAEWCFAMASAYEGSPLGPSPLRVDGCLDQPSLRYVVLNTVLEGCIGELVAAAEATQVAAHAEDEAVRALMLRIAADESRHAELAWRFVQWAIGEDPNLAHDVARLVESEACHAATAVASMRGDAREEERLLRLGVTPPRFRVALRHDIIAGAVIPGVKTLFARRLAA